MKLAFYDPNDLDYDAASPCERALGGSESALCYLSVELAKRGHDVWMLTGTRNPRRVMNVNCVQHRAQSREFFSQPLDVFVVLNGPAELGAGIRSILNPRIPLLMWTGHGPTEGAVQSLRDNQVRRSWDCIVCVSSWHRQVTVESFALDESKVIVLRNAI